MFATLVALATTRVGLVVHELGGHGGAATALGAEVDDVRLFWFAGGWIHYGRGTAWTLPASVTVQLAGIAIQLVLGTILVAVGSRRDGWLRIALIGAGAGWLVHGAAYLAIGSWHGYGDGLLVHRALGDAKAAVAIPAGALAVAVAFLAARALAGPLAASVPARRRAHRLAAVAIAVATAGGIHAGLARAELAIRADPTYGAIMRHERDRAIDRELAAWLAAQRAHGPVDPQALAAERDALERAHRTFPFGPILIVAIAAAGVAGAVVRRAAAPRPVRALTVRTLSVAAIAAALALALVVAAAAAFPL